MTSRDADSQSAAFKTSLGTLADTGLPFTAPGAADVVADVIAGLVSQVIDGAGQGQSTDAPGDPEPDASNGGDRASTDDGHGVFVEYYDTGNFGGHFFSEIRPSLTVNFDRSRTESPESESEADKGAEAVDGAGSDPREAYAGEPFRWRFSPQTMSARICAVLTPALTGLGPGGGGGGVDDSDDGGDIPVAFLVRASGPVVVFVYTRNLKPETLNLKP